MTRNDNISKPSNELITEVNFVELLHESISPTHAALVIDKDKGLLLFDLGSKFGTKLNGKKVKSHIGNPVKKKGDSIMFGVSTRLYQVHVDYSRLLAAQMQALKTLEDEVDLLAELNKDEDPSKVNPETFK